MGKYIYCFLNGREKKNFGISNLACEASPVYTVPFRDISAVVSDTNAVELDPTRKNLMAHQKVINRITESCNIIPVAFGTVAGSRKGIERIISDNYDSFRQQLTYFSDKQELGLRVTWKYGKFNEDIGTEEIRTLKNKLIGKKENEILSEKIELGRLVERATLEKKDEYKSLIYDPLNGLAVESKLKENIPIETVFNAFFLIRKADGDKFDILVEKLCKPFEEKLLFSYTGPWPPYNFIEMKLNVSDGDMEE